MEEPMKRFGWICLIALLITALLLGFWNRDLLMGYLNCFNGEMDVDEPAPNNLTEDSSAPGGGTAEPAVTDLKSLAQQITVGASSDYEKLTAIYDWVTNNIAYDVEKAKNMESEDYDFGAEYLLKNRKGVCHDYAELTRALLKSVGIKATYERGEVHPAPGKTERHAWNHACIGETWYGLDTTWGAGFVDERKGIFIQRPSRLYLTTPEKLARLHSDPDYKKACEIEWQRTQAAAAKPVCLPEHEARLLELFNETRTAAGLAPFKKETRLQDTVRQRAADAAVAACRGEEYSLDELNAELKQKASKLRLSKAGLYVFTLWDYPTPTAEEIHLLIISQEETFLYDGMLEALTVGVIRRGDLVTVVLVGLSYY
jgi:hypothetical protein